MITVNNYVSLDYEKERRMKVVVSATDGLLYAYATVWVELIDINDNAPQFAQAQYYASVQEHSSMGAYVTKVNMLYTAIIILNIHNNSRNSATGP
jgi:hypothetical protein